MSLYRQNQQANGIQTYRNETNQLLKNQYQDDITYDNDFAILNSGVVSPITNGRSKGLLNGPGKNNCFLNCAVQVSFLEIYILFVYYTVPDYCNRKFKNDTYEVNMN